MAFSHSPFQKASFFLSGLLTFAASQSAQAVVVYDFGDAFNNGAFGLESTNTTRSGITFWHTGAVSASTTGLFYDDVSVTDPLTGVSFTFDFTVDSANAQTDALTAALGVNNSSLGENSGFFDNGDQISFTFSDLQVVTPNATASFLGYVDVGTDFNGNNIGEGITIDFNGTSTTFTRGGTTTPSTYANDNDPRQGIHGQDVDANVNPTLTNLPFFNTNASTTVEFDGASVMLRGVSLGFDTAVVPEPSSVAFVLGSLGLGFLRRRR